MSGLPLRRVCCDQASPVCEMPCAQAFPLSGVLRPAGLGEEAGRAAFRLVSQDADAVRADGTSLRGRRSQWIGSGPALQAATDSPLLRNVAEQVARSPVVPTGSWYLRYLTGDHIGIHTDQDECSITVLVTLTGGDEPLVVYPGHVGAEPGNLLDLSVDSGGHPPGGVALSLTGAWGLVLRGRVLPHSRPARTRTQPLIVAAGCYAMQVRD